ncbi:diguanylate phosphodiesterase [Photobacterium gaetbulicola]|uniref:Putative cellobiose-specific phosphotransferase system enzyme IIC n=2 Tax=Photobacterium gaetbulicola TaxID=1295392 RepID=A0A0C5W2A4_9GAMM|nr:putative cellobiose-specific phosphotransferase system enzyme IIC [Photobacterium gaetbulicola Gung47]PSU14515.1 diguanylate phosphodiesterase [Photobacterium gaetbulicola]
MALPVSLMAALFNLLSIFTGRLGYDSISVTLGYVGEMTGHMFPLLLNIFLTTYYSSILRLPKAASISCALASFFIISQQWDLISPVIALPNNFLLSLLTAYASCIIISRIHKVRLFDFDRFITTVDSSIQMIVTCVLTLAILIIAAHSSAVVFKTFIQPEIVVPELDPSSLKDGLIYELVRGILWSLGINGHNILHVYKTELYDISIANMADWKNFGAEINIISTNFYDFFTGMGGSGNTISLVICMLIFAKSKGYLLLAKAALILTIFNINEPILFGIPIIFNPIMILPFLSVPLLSFLLAYGATAAGFIPPLTEVHSWLIPPVLSGYIASGGEISVAFFQIFLIVVGVVVYYPFFKIMDKRSLGVDVSSIFRTHFFKDDELPLKSKLNSFIPSIQDNMNAQREVEKLQSSGSFVLYYQPQLDIQRSEVVALEALLRHEDVNGRVTGPTFLKSFGQLGLLADVDLWVLEKAISDASEMVYSPNFTVSVNMSADTMLKKGFVKSLKQVIDCSRLKYEQVEIEVTEEVLIQDEVRTAKVIQEIKAMGVSVALDDFGTGYSSLAYLSRFEFDKIKIDRSLVENLHSERGRSLFDVVVQLGHITQAKIVVEGVETVEELDFIHEKGVQYVQGFFFYRPMTKAQIIVEHIVPTCSSQARKKVSSEIEVG